MPEEFSRTTARKRVMLPSGSHVDVPVITKISFVDPADRSQEWQYSIDNSAESGRTVHIDQLPSTENPGGDKLPVERIDKWPHVDVPDRGQETHLEMDNITGFDTVPPSFTTHLKTHVVRYKNVDDQHIWIDSELIDELVVLDPADRAQETHYTLNNPQNDDDAQANPDDPEISDTNNGIDPPWRTDPFQNIINFSDMHLVFTVSIVYRTPTATGDVVSGDFGQGIAPTDLVNDGVTTYSHFYMTSRRIVGEVSVVGFESSNPFFVAPSDEHVTLHGLPSGYTLSNVSPAQYQKSTTATGNWGGSSAVGSNPVSIFPSDETGRWEWTQGSIYNEPMWPGGPIPTAGTPPQSYGTQLSAPWKMRGSTLTSGATFGSTFIVADLWATCDVGESTSGPSTVWNPATPAPSHTETFDWTGITLIYMGKTYEPVAAVAQYPDDGKIFNNGAFQALFKVIEPTA